jgi:hypothetical protein
MAAGLIVRRMAAARGARRRLVAMPGGTRRLLAVAGMRV